MVGACLEALAAETYRYVTPAWYETALKVKYSRDDLSTQMIDLIKDSATSNFIYAFNYAINGMGLIYRDLVTNNNTDYASALKRKEKAGLKSLNKVLDVFRGIEE
jgi:disulfide oxidoreductase YuzD